MNKYLEMKKRHQAEVNKMPFICAFSEKQLKENMQKAGLNYPDDVNQLAQVCSGTFIKKADSSDGEHLSYKQRVICSSAIIHPFKTSFKTVSFFVSL